VFVFAGSSDPVALDPAFASDSESSRVTNQIFEGLVGYKEGSSDIEPRLATEWSQSADGLNFTFKLREGVKFSDGTPFDAEAVCFNFERWYNWTGQLQAQNITNYYQLVFKGFKTSDDPALTDALYSSCAANGDHEATVTLTRPYGLFIPALAVVPFAMQSPTALKKYDADNVTAEGSDVRFGEYATEHPTGTGPFMFDSWDKGQQITLVANPDYWGEPPKVAKVIVRTIGDPTARVQALKNGEIDAYDMVSPTDLPTLEADGFRLLRRDPYNVLYLGMDQNTEVFKDQRVRQAIAYGIDKEALIAQVMPPGTEAAVEFLVPVMTSWTDKVEKYSYDPDKARALLKEAGQENMAVDFYYPTGTSRPYMPNPEDIFVNLRTQLEALGIKVNGIPQKWSPEYLDTIKAVEGHSMWILGGTHTIDAETLGVFFGGYNLEWGFDDPKIFEAIAAARAKTNLEESAAAYGDAAVLIAEKVPGVPLAHVPVTVAVSPKVSGYVPNPTSADLFKTVSVG
jgi:peptide/nickel transport system substrate-binding protein